MNRYHIFVLMLFAVSYQSVFAQNSNPYIIFPKNFISNGQDNSQNALSVLTTGQPVVYNCSDYKVDYIDSKLEEQQYSFYCGAIRRTWTVTSDCFGQPQNYNQIILYSDTTLPTVKDDSNIVSYSSTTVCDFRVKINKPTFSDFSGIKHVSVFIESDGKDIIGNVQKFPYEYKIDSTYLSSSLTAKFIVIDNCGNYLVKKYDLSQAKTKLMCQSKTLEFTSKELLVKPDDLITFFLEGCGIKDKILKKTISLTNILLGCLNTNNNPTDTIRYVGKFQALVTIETEKEVYTCKSQIISKNSNKIVGLDTFKSVKKFANICVNITDYKNAPIKGVSMDFEGQTPIDNKDGTYCVKSQDCNPMYWLNFITDKDPLNGLSTLDIILISRHILGVQPISTEHGKIAADVNADGKISTADIVELRKIILGIKPYFNKGESWRFFDENYQAMPMIMNNKNEDYTKKIIAVKVGDVSGDAKTD